MSSRRSAVIWRTDEMVIISQSSKGMNPGHTAPFGFSEKPFSEERWGRRKIPARKITMISSTTKATENAMIDLMEHK
jgi:hypothetical protein